MVVLTVFMLILFLVLVPLRIGISFRIDLTSKRLKVRLTVFGLPLFKENFTVSGKYLVCDGTVETKIDLLSVDGKSGVNLAKALVFEKVNLVFAVDYTKISPFTMLALEGACGTLTTVACALSNCQVRTQTGFSLDNAVYGDVSVTVTLADIFIVLIKEKLRTIKAAK